MGTSKFDSILEGRTSEDLIEVLHKTQDLFGYIPEEVIDRISDKLNVPVSKIYGVCTFYSRFSLVPKGKFEISVCVGTACYVKGGDKVLEEFEKQLGIGVGETSHDGLFSIVETRCVGDCANAPVVTVNDKVYKKVSPKDVENIIYELSQKEE